MIFTSYCTNQAAVPQTERLVSCKLLNGSHGDNVRE